jgi:predicted RNA-binding protein associated with RNAse of E/G family
MMGREYTDRSHPLKHASCWSFAITVFLIVTRLIHLEYRRPGKPAMPYHEWLVLDRPDVKVLLLEPYEGKTVLVGGQPIQDSGAPIVWFVFPERWYDIGRFHLGDERFTGWYTNLCRPPQIEGDRWIGNDLFLDLWQPVRGPSQWLDEDEFEAAVRDRLLDEPTRQRVLNERVLIDLQLREQAWPPAIAQDIDLSQARVLRRT